MRKTAVFGLAAFYLLLTTGMFVCLVHCTAEKVLSHHQEMAGMAESHHHAEHSKKPCKGGKGCSCCDQHGTYVVKENIKPSVEPLQFQQTFLITFLPEYYHSLNSTFNTRVNLWTDSHAPPGPSGKDYLIRIRTLLI